MLSSAPGQSFISKAKFHNRINIRIRNVKFETWQSTLKRYPKTLLGCEGKRHVYYDELTDEFVFDRSVPAFDSILFYYQSNGILNRPTFLTMEEFLDECNFFELEEKDIKRLKEFENYDEVENESEEQNEKYEDSDETLELLNGSVKKSNTSTGQNNNCINSCRTMLWEFFEEPSSSKIASVFAIFSFVLITASVVLACMLTIPEIQNSRNPDLFRDPWALIELSLNGCFALEYFLRLTVAPKLIKFIISPVNLIDLSAFFPYFIVLLINPGKISTLSFLRMLRMIRVLRLLRLSKQSKNVAAVMEMLKKSVKDIFTLVLCYFIAAVVFGSLQYYMEVGAPGTPFNSIPQSMWWAFQTIIPLGYGDIVPSGLKGKIIGGSVALFGAITLTVPLLHLGGKYLAGYAEKTNIPVGKDLKLDDRTAMP